MKKSQKGFGAVEAVLILVIIGLLGGTGWYVWNSAHPADKDLDNAANTAHNDVPVKTSHQQARPSTIVPSQKYISIKEWGVRIPYDGDDTYSYTHSSTKPEMVNIISKNLAEQYKCTSSGAGQIARRKPTDPPNFNYLSSEMEATVQQDAAVHPSRYVHLGNYYYAHLHDSTACSTTITGSPSGLAAQNSANVALDNLISKIEPLSN